MRKPAWVKRREIELADAGLTAADLGAAQREYEAVGLNLARVDKGWRVFGMHKARTFILWGNLGGLVTGREGIMAEYAAMVAEVVAD